MDVSTALKGIRLQIEQYINPGHIKIISRRHVLSITELTEEELLSMQTMLRDIEKLVDSEHHTTDYNLGYSHGKIAGQTKFHLHVHYIPRFEGDVEDPTGGIRNLIPEKVYLESD